MRIITRFVLQVTTLALTTACSGGPSTPPAPMTSTVEALIGDASCDTDAQCRTVPVGAKACGGPAAYLPWSSRITDGAALQAVAGREADDARARIEKSGVMSNCSIVNDPGAYCAAAGVAGAGTSVSGSSSALAVRRCRLRPSGNPGASKIY